MRSDPSISIVLPVYNGKKYLAQAIESALDQSLGDFELLISDDASTDNSWEIIENYRCRDKRINAWRNESNLGLFDNYNHCLRRASGTYIKTFAQDDLWDPTILEKMVSALECNPSAVLAGTAKRWIGADGQELRVLRLFPETRVIKGREVILANLIGLTNWVGEPSSVLFRRQVAGTGFDTAFYHYGDVEYWFRILEHGDYLYLDEVLCDFRRHSEQSTSTNLGGLYFALDIFRLGKLYRSYLEELGESEDQFYRRAVETIAVHLDHLVREERLTPEKVNALDAHSQKNHTATDLQAIPGFKEVTYHSLRYVHHLLRELYELNLIKDRWTSELSRLELLEAQIADLHNSTSWKLTAPLRSIASMLGPSNKEAGWQDNGRISQRQARNSR